jgi:hypothetical protein
VKKERERGDETIGQGVRNVVENRYLLMIAWHQAVAVVVERREGYCIYKGMMTVVNERRREVILCVDSHSVGQSDGCDFGGGSACVCVWVSVKSTCRGV